MPTAATHPPAPRRFRPTCGRRSATELRSGKASRPGSSWRLALPLCYAPVWRRSSTVAARADVAQSAEQLFCKQQVAGSIPVVGSTLYQIGNATPGHRLERHFLSGPLTNPLTTATDEPSSSVSVLLRTSPEERSQLLGRTLLRTRNSVGIMAVVDRWDWRDRETQRRLGRTRQLREARWQRHDGGHAVRWLRAALPPSELA